MTETTPIPIMRFTNEAYHSMRALAQQQPELWLNPNTDFAEILRNLNINPYAETTGLVAAATVKLPSAAMQSNRNKALGDREALRFRENIKGITPAQMTDPQLLAYLSCIHLLEFGISRWPIGKNTNLPQHVLAHYLPEKGRHLNNGSIAGRTLWLAETAQRIADQLQYCTPETVLEHFCRNPEHYHNCTEYYIMRSPLILSEYAGALMKGAQGISREGARELARDLNRAAGPRLLDTLPRPEMRRITEEAVDHLMQQPEYVTDRSKLRGRQNFQVLSLGAGVQSTVMALMAEQGYDAFSKPDIAIFADTGWEPSAVYEHLNWLEKQLSYPVVRVSNGNIKEDILNGINPEGRQFIDMPVYVTKDDGKQYVGTRQCTKQYKLKPIHKYLREILKLAPGKRAPKETQVEMWLGLSIDEASRVKPSREEWITLSYPLLDRNLSRNQLYQWFKERYPNRKLPKSACIGCPYHSDQMWAEMKKNDPESFQEAVHVEWAMQNVPQSRGALDGTAYLHRSRKPLSQVKFNTQNNNATMAEECEGICGI